MVDGHICGCASSSSIFSTKTLRLHFATFGLRSSAVFQLRFDITRFYAIVVEELPAVMMEEQ
jgi:hypothetical protein